MSEELNSVLNYIKDVIKSKSEFIISFDHLFDTRVECQTIIENNEEQILLNNINDILFDNRNKDLITAVIDVNYILRMSLYFDKKNKFEEVVFLVSDYQNKFL